MKSWRNSCTFLRCAVAPGVAVAPPPGVSGGGAQCACASRTSVCANPSKFVDSFAVRANDYCIDDLKFGGNAQSISGKRWLHHTSLLWDYEPARMALLQHPARQPEYQPAGGGWAGRVQGA